MAPSSATVYSAEMLSCRNKPSGSFFCRAYHLPAYCQGKKINRCINRYFIRLVWLYTKCTAELAKCNKKKITLYADDIVRYKENAILEVEIEVMYAPFGDQSLV